MMMQRMGPARRMALAMAVVVAACGLAACGERESKSVLEVRRHYAGAFREGVDVGLSGHIIARAVDPDTLDLIDLHIDEGMDRLIHADRAEILVDPASNTMRLRLHGVTNADVSVGLIVDEGVITTDAVKLGYEAR